MDEILVAAGRSPNVEDFGLKAIAKTIHPYPTQAEAIRKTADAYSFTRLIPFVKKLSSIWLAWSR